MRCARGWVRSNLVRLLLPALVCAIENQPFSLVAGVIMFDADSSSSDQPSQRLRAACQHAKGLLNLVSMTEIVFPCCISSYHRS